MSNKTREQISYNMKRVKAKDTEIEMILRNELWNRGLRYRKNVKDVYGKPDIVFLRKKIAIFVDGEFWHGYDWENRKKDHKSNQEFWYDKIERNMQRDEKVNQTLSKEGWTVLRFWGNEVKRDVALCADKIEAAYFGTQAPFRTIDLCAGIGGIRKGFELTGHFKNVKAAEIDKYACLTYKHLFGDDPYNDLTCETFKQELEKIDYDVLLAGFPCQTFSRAGLEEGFNNEEKGIIFNHIAEIIDRTKPKAIFLENVDNLVRHDSGNTFRVIIDTLERRLNYKVIGVNYNQDGQPCYDGKSFVRNSKFFGIPQNRPRTYIMAFDRERYGTDALMAIDNSLPKETDWYIYDDLNEVIELHADPKYYLSSGYLETLEKHRSREHDKGNGFGYRVVNSPEIEHPMANTIMATGGSGKERNLIYDPQDGIAGRMIQNKKSPINDKGIRVMTPREWGKLQGFINYAFIDEDGNDTFGFPDEISMAQQYKQFGNSVTIPVIESMADFMLNCFRVLGELPNE